MTPLFKKLNFKNFERIAVLNAPEEFEKELNEMMPFTTIDKAISSAAPYNFVLAFVKTDADITACAELMKENLADDVVLWFAYPKQSSKKYKSTINRDRGWSALGQLGYEPVRMVAIDNDWSALRFRNIKNIKNFNRKFGALSDEGKERIAGKE